ncbi:nitrous oxide reductase accessory protein NosL [Nitratifractor sp.]
MKSLLLFVFLIVGIVQAAQVDAAQYARLVAKGEKIAHRLCDPTKLPKLKGGESPEEIANAVKASGACPPLNEQKMKALVTFLQAGRPVKHAAQGKEISVPEGAKCPVCGMFVSKYPKWAAEMVVNGKTYYFDGVKDMMKFYIFDGDFPYDRSKIEKMLVTDYYTLESIPAKEAYYVIGSKLYGPMGNELIPFKSEKEARDFIVDHGGDRIVRFDQITAKMVMGLDGIDYSEE